MVKRKYEKGAKKGMSHLTRETIYSGSRGGFSDAVIDARLIFTSL